MASITHQKVSAIPDAGDPTLIEPSDWNATHVITGLTIGSDVEAWSANLDAWSAVPVANMQGKITLTTTGSSGAATLVGNTLNVPNYTFTDTGITQVTGDVTAGPGSGSQAATVVAINGTALSALATGILKNTTGTGVPSIATAADFPTLNQNTTGSSASFTGALAGDVTGTQGATVVGKLNGTSLAGLATGLLVNTTATGVPTIKTAPAGTVLGTTDTQTLTNKNLTSGTNTFPTFNQNTSGSAASFTGSLAGDVTGTQGATVVGKINGTSLAGLATGILKNTVTTGVPSIATGADLPAMTATVGGAVPTPPNNTTTFLRGDGTFATPAGSSGTVTSASVATANGFAGTVATATTTPAITLTTSVTGITKGNGTALSAATAGTDYVAPGGALGTPSSGVATNLTGTAAGLTAGNVTTNANLTGDVTSVGNATTLTNAPVIAKVLTGYVSGAGTVSATDSILQAIQKLNGNDATNANLTGPITSVGNATSIASQTGTGSKFVVDTGPTVSALTATGTTTPTGLVDISGASAGQLKFPATQNPSANANTLDDYSEGTFTPTFVSTGATFSYASQFGEYIKIGKLVFFQAMATLNVSGNTLTANALTISGLPYTSGTLASGSWGPFQVQWATSTTSYVFVQASIPNAGTSITISGITAAANSILPLNSNGILANGASLRVSGTYMAAN